MSTSNQCGNRADRWKVRSPTLTRPLLLSQRMPPGAFFGEMALISGEPRMATVSAATAVSLLSLHSADFQMLCSSSPEIAEIIRKTALERRGAAPIA